MATIGRTNGASLLNTPRLSYISTAPFNTYFYSYSTSINRDLETVGTLSAVVGATSGNCPKGRVLRENGRKLYPEANPGITTYLVGVYDAQTMLSGFIDPNAKVFQIYNTDKPTYLADGDAPSDLGPSVYTRGDILAVGNLDISGSSYLHGGARIDNGLTVYGGETVATGDLNVTLGTITAAKQIRSTTITNLGNLTTSATINVSLGQVFKFAATDNTVITASNLAPGALVYIIIEASGANRTIDFNAPFRTVNAGVRTINSGTFNTFSFICDGTNLWQIAEATILTA
jgi:hypothetical protein